MFKKRHPPVGSMPGTLVFGDAAQRPAIRVMKYKPGMLQEIDCENAADAHALLDDETICWIDVHGLGDEKTLREFAELFKITPLALEAVVNVPQRPKVETHDSNLLCITRMMKLTDDRIEPEQVSIFLGSNYVLTFQERPGDVFEPVRERIRMDGPIFRRSGSSYLTYAIIDAVIDAYYPILEHYGYLLETLEDAIVEKPRPALLHEVHGIKRDLLAIRRGIWPQRELINSMIRDEFALVTEHTKLHLRDCYDHAVQIMDAIETFRELCGGLMDVYLSSIGNRQNEVMKVLTIMASIFIPITFLAGIYGMNFEKMPELKNPYGYPTLLAIMAALVSSMLWWFYSKGWLGNRDN